MMTWYQISEQDIRPFASQAHAYHYALQQKRPITDVRPLALSPFSTREFVRFLTHVIHHCQKGHSLQSALINSHSDRTSSRYQLTRIAIKTSLAQGASVSAAIMPHVSKSLKTVMALIPDSGPQESKIAALNVAKELAQSQLTLTEQLLKSLLYPFSIIQCALAMAFINKLVSGDSYLYLAIVWGLVTSLQSGLALWVAAGAAPPLLAKYLTSFRSYLLLSALLAMLKGGDTLQAAIKKLCQTCLEEDKVPLYRTYLHLQNGCTAYEALPKQWFFENERLLLASVHQTGDLISPLESATSVWQRKNDRILKLVAKGIPIFGIVVSSIFVANTLIELYAPLMEVNTFGI